MPVIDHGEWRIDFSDDGAGKPVVLIHSSVSGNRQWRRLIHELSDRYRVLAVNLFGYGETTPWPGDRPQRLDDQVDLVLAVLAASDEEAGSATLIGHSMGGAIALKAALMLGQRVAKLVLLEPNLFHLLALEGRTAVYDEAVGLRDHVKFHGAREDWIGAAPLFADYWLGAGNWKAMAPERQAAFAEGMRANYHEWDAAMGETTPLDAVKDIAAETLILQAAETQRPIVEIVELLRTARPDWRYAEIAEGGHMAPLVRPDLVNPVIAEFLDGAA